MGVSGSGEHPQGGIASHTLSVGVWGEMKPTMQGMLHNVHSYNGTSFQFVLDIYIYILKPHNCYI